MTPEELYALLDKAGVDYDVVEIFEGARTLRVMAAAENDDERSI